MLEKNVTNHIDRPDYGSPVSEVIVSDKKEEKNTTRQNSGNWYETIGEITFLVTENNSDERNDYKCNNKPIEISENEGFDFAAHIERAESKRVEYTSIYGIHYIIVCRSPIAPTEFDQPQDTY